jgi:hypothetical protein
MQLGYAILAAAAYQEADGRLFVMNGGLDGLMVNKVPGAIPSSLYFAFRVNFTQEECGREHEFVIEFAAPSGAVIFNSASRVTPAPPNPPGRHGKVGALIQFLPTTFTEAGLYTLRLTVDGRELSTTDVVVATPEAQPAPAPGGDNA